MLETMALTQAALRELMLFAAFGLAFSGLDDLFIDLVYVNMRLVRLIAVRPRHRPMPAESMGSEDPGWFAILVPAWDEAAVIGTMLRGLTNTYVYPRYRVFVGCYPNDPETMAEVAGVDDPRVERVVTTQPGPTTKADCLNHLWRAALAYEARADIRFKAVVLHDAEDVVHAAELQVFDHLIGRLDLIQLPVMPIVDPGSRWIAGHYLDEFAEAHAKDVVVREALGAAVPSAGVACAVARHQIALLARTRPGAPFDPTCFTEDYELGQHVKRAGGRGALVRVRDARGALVATHEHFPHTLATAVRQKSRWMLGIALDGWDRLGWVGDGADQYMFWRDRKPLFLAPLSLLAWLTTVGALAMALLAQLWPPARALGRIALEHSWLAALLTLNAGLLGWRLLLRFTFTTRAYGWREGLRSVPRIVVANAINTVATARAFERYFDIAIGRRKAIWEKTAHRIPLTAAR